MLAQYRFATHDGQKLGMISRDSFDSAAESLGGNIAGR
jgi:hypothetical protein